MCQHQKATASSSKDDDLSEATPVTACTSTSSSPRIDDASALLSSISPKDDAKPDLEEENGQILSVQDVSRVQAAGGALKAQIRESYREHVLAWFASLSVRERVRALMIDDQRFLQTIVAMKHEQEDTRFFIRDECFHQKKLENKALDLATRGSDSNASNSNAVAKEFGKNNSSKTKNGLQAGALGDSESALQSLGKWIGRTQNGPDWLKSMESKASARAISPDSAITRRRKERGPYKFHRVTSGITNAGESVKIESK